MNDEPLVEFRSVGHEYGRRTALDDVSFSVDRASFFALLGPNGCGKTTLLRILTTLLKPDAGSASIDGPPLEKLGDYVNENPIAEEVALP